MSSELKRVHAIVEGRVQGVCFRAQTRQEAVKLALVGWVRNRADGSVETEFEGETKEVGQMLNLLGIGYPGSKVLKVTSKDCPVLGSESHFNIQY